MLRATHAASAAGARAAIRRSARFDAFWIVGGRVADWGALPGELEEIEARTAAALARAPRPGETAHVAARGDRRGAHRRELAGVADDAPALALEPAPDGERLAAFVRRAQAAGLITQNSR